MGDAKRVTILNQGQAKFVLPPDPDELKENPKAKARELPAGRTLEVSAEEAEKLLTRAGLVDLSKLAATDDSAEVKDLKAQLAAAQAENAKLKGGAPEDEELGDGDAVLTPAGDKGTIVKIKKKGMADVKLENGNVSAFKLSDLKADPEAAAA